MDTEALVSGQITFTGLGSGTDFKSMVDQLVQLERRHTARLELWKKEWEEKKAAFQDLNTKLLNLRTGLQKINTMSKFLVKTAESGNKNVLTATASDKAQVGNHVIEVNQLAQTHILAGETTQDNSRAVINNGDAGVFAYSYKGGAVRTLNVPAGTTLEGLRNLINSDPENPGVRAGIIKTGDNEYILQIRGMDQGQGKDIVIDPSTTIDGYQAGDFITSQTAQNSQIKVDGFPPGTDAWITRSTNAVNDLIEGVSITLRSTGTTTLNIAVDNEKVKSNVTEFVNQVNDVFAMIKDLTQVVGESQGSILTGNYGIQLINSRLKSILAVKGTGFDVNNDVFSSLGMVGIKTDADRGSPTFGMLVLDEEVLDHSLRNRPNELAQIFAADHIGSSNSPNHRFFTSIDGLTKAGEYTIEYTVSGGRVTQAFINGRSAEISDIDEFTGRFGNPEAGMAIKVENLTDGVYKYLDDDPAQGVLKVFLKEGKAGELHGVLKDLTDTADGPLNILKDNYKDIIKGIDRKIEFEERRIARYEKDLRNRFARLETLLGYYDSLGQSLNSQLGQLRNDTA